MSDNGKNLTIFDVKNCVPISSEIVRIKNNVLEIQCVAPWDDSRYSHPLFKIKNLISGK